MRRYIFRLIFLSLPLLVVYAIPTWLGNAHMLTGDHGTVGALVTSKAYRTVFNYLPQRDFEVTSTEDIYNLPVDSTVLVMGDSFSQYGTGSFHEYAACSMPGWKFYEVSTRHNYEDFYYIMSDPKGGDGKYLISSATDVLLYLLGSGRSLPRYVVIESVERGIMRRLAATRQEVTIDSLRHFPDFQHLRDSMNFLPDMRHMGDVVFMPKETWFDKYCKKLSAMQDFWKKKFGIGNELNHLRLRCDAFSENGNERDLYFINAELTGLQPELADQAADNLQRLVALAQSRGVTFIYLVCPDKYDIYKEYAMQNPYPQETNLDYLMPKVSTDGHVIDLRPALRRELENGKMDLYYYNDTHWTPYAAEIAGDELKKCILRHEDIRNNSKLQQ